MKLSDMIKAGEQYAIIPEVEKLEQENERLKEDLQEANRRNEEITGIANEYARIIQGVK